MKKTKELSNTILPFVPCHRGIPMLSSQAWENRQRTTGTRALVLTVVMLGAVLSPSHRYSWSDLSTRFKLVHYKA